VLKVVQAKINKITSNNNNNKKGTKIKRTDRMQDTTFTKKKS
jgi:hypothetical protein